MAAVIFESALQARLTSLVEAPSGPYRERSDAYQRRIVGTDFAAVALAALLAFGPALSLGAEGSGWYVVLAVQTVSVWMWALWVTRSRDRRVLGLTRPEFARLAQATGWTFASVAVLGYVTEPTAALNHMTLTLPFGFLLLVAGRTAWRLRLQSDRARGLGLAQTLVVGSTRSTARLVAALRRDDGAYRVVGLCLSDVDGGAASFDAPVLGGMDRVVEVATEAGVDVVALTSADSLTDDYVQKLSWVLHARGIDLMTASAIPEVARPRVLVTEVGRARLVHLEAPQFSGWKYAIKGAIDVSVAAFAALLLAPVLLAVAVAVKVTSPGPALFRQVRIGRNGVPFTIFKFRSMCVDADARLEQVVDGPVGLFYKPKNDPRITPVGGFIRRTSLDELPQLFNVLRGDMSLVGPRPQVEREVRLYDEAFARRLLVKPGLTGLWQVSGRNNLSIEESMRCDLHYVDNWSLTDDVSILARTFRAVARGAGAS